MDEDPGKCLTTKFSAHEMHSWRDNRASSLGWDPFFQHQPGLEGEQTLHIDLTCCSRPSEGTSPWHRGNQSVAPRELILWAYKDTQRGWGLSINTGQPSPSPVPQPSAPLQPNESDTAPRAPGSSAAKSRILKAGQCPHHRHHAGLVVSWELHFWHSLAEGLQLPCLCSGLARLLILACHV